MPKILEIKKYPEKILRTKSLSIEKVDGEIQSLLSDMAFTMHAYNGIGLAAPQVGINKQIAVVDIGNGIINLLNPKIVEKDGKSAIEEGCLSLPEVSLNIKRAASIKISALNENGKDNIIDAAGLLATVIQHEIDHLNGILIIDYANLIKKEFLKNRLLKQKSRKAM